MHINTLTIIQLLLPALFLVEVLFYQLVTRRFIARAIKTNATVLKVDLYSGRSSVYIPTLSFKDQSGKVITVEARMTGTSSTWTSKYKPGDEVPILYDGQNPEIFIADNWSGRWVYTFKRSAVTILVVIALGFAIIFLR